MDYISEELAQEIAEKTSRILGYNVIITDRKGIVIGAMDRSRLGTFHQASLKVTETSSTFSYSLADAAKLEGVLPGIAAPIIFNNKIIGVLGIAGDPDQLSKYTELVKNQVEMMCNQAYLLNVTQLKSRALESFVQDVLALDSSSKSSDMIFAQGSVLGFDLSIPRVAMVVNIRSFSNLTASIKKNNHGFLQDNIQLQYMKSEVLSHLQTTLEGNSQDIVTFLSKDKFIILKTINPKRSEQNIIKQLKEQCIGIIKKLDKSMQLEAVIGIGSYHDDARCLSLSYKEALNSLLIGKYENNNEKVYYVKDLFIGHVLAAIKASPSKVYLYHAIEGLQRNKQYNELKKTLLVLFENNFIMLDTAQQLFIHRNTLIRRLEKIMEITGLNPKNFNDAIRLYLAIKLEQIDK